jgi:hypothetical protein
MTLDAFSELELECRTCGGPGETDDVPTVSEQDMADMFAGMSMGQMTPPRPPSAGMFPPPPPPETPATDKGSKHRSRINGSGVTSDDDSMWTLGKWLKTVDLARAVEEALESEVPQGKAPLEFFKGDDLSQGRVHELLESARLGGLAETVCKALEGLRKQHTVHEMCDKFKQDDLVMLEFASLSSFFGGLEGKIGAPLFGVRVALIDSISARYFSPTRYQKARTGQHLDDVSNLI